MAVENLAEVIRSLSPEEQESVKEFVEFLKRRGPSPSSPFLSAVDEFIDQHSELLRHLAR
jgi:ferritin